MKKKLLTILLSVFMIATAFTINVLADSVVLPENGTWFNEETKNVWYKFEDEGKKLIIGGVGEIPKNPSGNSEFRNNTTITSCEIQSGVTSICDGLFDGCSNLASIKIPSTVTNIGYRVFTSCSKLTELHIDSLESWCKVSFGTSTPFSSNNFGTLYVGENKVTDVVFPETVETISGRTFYAIDIQSVTFPSSVTSINGNSFNNCKNLTKVVVKSSTPPELGSSNAFGNTPSDLKFVVPNESIDAYKGADNWSTYATKMNGAYMVNVASTENGKITVDKDVFLVSDYESETETVNVTVTPNDGCTLKSLSYYTTDPASSTDITTTKSFTMPLASITIKAEFEQSQSFEDDTPISVEEGYTGDLEFVTSATYTNDSDVTVKVDGDELTLNVDYELSHGSTHVKLLGDYVKTLAVGTHTITIGVVGYSDINTDFTITGSSPSPSPTPRYVIPNTGVN